MDRVGMNPQHSGLPLVSCAMPTKDRRAYAARAIAYFLAQDYSNKELVILDDGADSIGDLVPGDSPIRYLRTYPGRTLGAKRNDCVAECRGDLILHWDDDDWMAPWRIRYQVEALLSGQAEVCGLRQVLYLELATGRAWLYRYPEGQRPWLAGNTLLYTREFWRSSPFPDVQVASDTYFIWAHSLDRSVALPDYRFYVALIHPANTSPKQLIPPFWSRWNGDLAEVMGADLAFYAPGAERVASHRGPTVFPAGATLPRLDAVPSELTMASSSLPRAPAITGAGMRVGYVLASFPPLSETFIRREILALCRRGFRVFVYTHYLHRDPLVDLPGQPGLAVRQVSFLHDGRALLPAMRADGIEHVHSSLMLAAERAAFAAAEALQIPFSLTAYSGHDVFTATDPRLYEAMSTSPLCTGIVVEDSFMADWLTSRLGARADRLHIIPNSFDLDQYRLAGPRAFPPGTPHAGASPATIAILAIARFVEKKGLIHLVNAFQALCRRRSDVELWLAGSGPEEPRLRAAAGRNPLVKFLGAVSEARTRELYAAAGVFCMPCVRTPQGDADGIPTTVLEAMAFELPVVASDLLSMPCYVHDGQEGLLISPGDEAALVAALARLCADAPLREVMGKAGRARVAGLCDLNCNIERLAAMMVEGRRRRWEFCLAALTERRCHYTAATEATYEAHRVRAANFFQAANLGGRLLDVGCGRGAIRGHLGEHVTYFGCDPLSPEGRPEFPFSLARGEHLPFRSGEFDSVLFYSVLSYMLNVDDALAEAHRVLKPGGRLFLHECVNDANPIHLNHLSDADLRRRVAAHFRITDERPDQPGYLLLRAVKPGVRPAEVRVGPVQPNLSQHEVALAGLRPSQGAQSETGPSEQLELATRLEGPLQRALAPRKTSSAPLVSVAITTYNRAALVGAAIDSVLVQTHHPIEVVVVDDGSTDNTRRVLEKYGNAIRVAYHDHNRGIAAAKNVALRMTASDAAYVGILDSDDYYHPRFVERCVDRLERTPDVGLVYADDILVNRDGVELWRRGALEPWSLDGWLASCNLRGDTWLARRELVMRTRLHDETLRFDVDYDLFYQLLQFTTFSHLAEFLVYIRRHDGQSTRDALELARCHAANLVRYGHSPSYAYLRGRNHPEWKQAIEEGIALGRRLAEARSQHG